MDKALKNSVRVGRPRGAKTFEEAPARAFGLVVRSRRLLRNVTQDELALTASVERSYMGKLERGMHLPNLAMILRIATALECSPADLVQETVDQMNASLKPPNRRRKAQAGAK